MTELNAASPFNSMLPWEQISFEKLNKKYRGMSSGDWILEKETTPHPYWVLYKPSNSDTYNVYHIGFSKDQKSIFSIRNDPRDPIVIKQSDAKMMGIIEKQLKDLQ